MSGLRHAVKGCPNRETALPCDRAALPDRTIDFLS